jgi:threonine aldolase
VSALPSSQPDFRDISFYDTSTLPTDSMLDAIRRAPLGDDMYGADPTVNELEATVAALLGKEASMLVPSGTMANLVALLTLCRPGDEVITEEESHIVYYEAGGMAAMAGVMPLLVRGEDGVMRAAGVEPHLRRPNQHYPHTALLCVENTHNRAGGTVTTPAVMAELRDLCDRHGLAIHIDGARLFNAAVALDVPPAALAEHADSVTVALSKGLSAPVGSVLAGSSENIAAARRARKLVGGAMRQAGVVAAAGIVALREQLPRLVDDHRRAAQLARDLAEIDGVRVHEPAIRTNMVLIDTEGIGKSADEATAELLARGIKASSRPPWTVRFVTHRLIGEDEASRLLAAMREIAGA